MIHLDCDYMSGALPEVMRALVETNAEQTPGYGSDTYTDNAKRLIREICNAPDAEVYLMIGGTQTNATVIDAILRPSQGVVAADSGHINVHEAGAIESSAHKVLTLPQHQGKIQPHELRKYLEEFYADDTWPHMVIPGMVYISYPTEFGTLYTRKELVEISDICHSYNIPLYIDGARLGYGVASPQSDVTIADIAAISDVMYIGGTKQGLLMGEAVVAKPGVLHDFFTIMKRHGAVLAKGRLLGVEFSTLFTDDLYLTSSRKAVDLAMQLKNGFIKAGYAPIIDSPTNQQFFRLPNELIDRLHEKVTFNYWGPRGEESSEVRFVTSWATTRQDIDKLLSLL